MARESAYPWEFRARFRKHAFGWRSQPAILRVRQAVTEIKRVARKDPVLAADGAVLLITRLSPALENVDSSSGAIGSAVNGAIADLVPIIAGAPADEKTRSRWLERLYEAHAADGIPYIEQLTEYWGELCASTETASAWADRLLPITRMALSPEADLRGHFHATTGCLSALHRAGRFEELLDVLKDETFWHYKIWAVKALLAQGKHEDALACAEACRSPWASDAAIDRVCEEILLSMGRSDEAYRRYGARVPQGRTYLAIYRDVCRKYPHRRPDEILFDLVGATPGKEGKWFAAAKDAGFFDEALGLASQTPCDPRTLARAARDHAQDRPYFAVEAGLLAIHWLLEGHGYEITALDVRTAREETMKAAWRLGNAVEVEQRIRRMARERPGEVADLLTGGS